MAQPSGGVSVGGLFRSRSLSELLEQAVRRYQNRAIETAQELIALARELREADARGEELNR